MFYGRNLDIRIPPRAEARGARFLAPATPGTGVGAKGGTSSFSGGVGQITLPAGCLPIGAPVVVNLDVPEDAYGRQVVELAGEGALTTDQGIFGVALFEYGPAWSAGYDIYITTYSDMGFIPPGQAIIVVWGDPATKFVFRNTVPNQFLGIQNYPGRTMVAGMGATPTFSRGQYLVPGNGNDTDGYWQATATRAGAWAVITSVNPSRLEVEAQLLF